MAKSGDISVCHNWKVAGETGIPSSGQSPGAKNHLLRILFCLGKEGHSDVCLLWLECVPPKVQMLELKGYCDGMERWGLRIGRRPESSSVGGMCCPYKRALVECVRPIKRGTWCSSLLMQSLRRHLGSRERPSPDTEPAVPSSWTSQPPELGAIDHRF